MMKKTLFAMGAICALLLVSPQARASVCRDRCEEAYSSCAAVEAIGCEIGSDLAGKAASELGNQIPIPGMGALFGGLAKKGTKEACEKKLAPCQKIKDTCLAECPAESTGTTGTGHSGAAAIPVPQPAARATFRVFSDRPRTIVYVNGERMGATPQDPLEPFVTPDLRVGKYWVRLMTPDSEWQWEGAKDVEEGNINAVEGKLENLHERTWAAALSLDHGGDALKAIDAYEAFARRYPSSALVTVAMARITALREQLAAAEKELFSRIENEKNPETRIALCGAYVKAFGDGPNRVRVDQLLLATRQEVKQAAQEAEREAKAFFVAKSVAITKFDDSDAIIEAGSTYLSTYPEGAHRAEVERFVGDARSRKEKKERESVGRAQRGWGITFMTIGGALGVTGAIVGGVTLSQYGDLKDDCGSTAVGCSDSDIEANHSQAVATNWILGSALVSLVGGVLLYTLAPKAEQAPAPVTAAVMPTGDGAMVGVSGAF